MNIQKLRDMNLHAVADELEQLRAYKEAAENRSMAWLANALEQYANGDVITVPSGAGTEEEFFTWLKDQGSGSSTAVAVPDDVGMIPMINGKPKVTERMKVECIGEFSWREEAPYYDENGELHDHVATHEVPWDVCKEIYKRMASAALLAAPSHSQQSAKSGYAGVTVWVGDKTITQIVSRLEIETSSADELLRRFENARHLLSQSDRCPSHESEQGGEV